MKKVILWSIVSVVIVGVAINAFLWFHKPQSITLSNGTKLTLLGVTYGKHHVPPKVKITGGRVRGGGARMDSTNDTAVVWILSEHKANQYPNYQLMVYDKADTACVSAWARTQSQIKNGMEIQGFALDAYPRWDSKMVLRVMTYGQRGQQVSKEQFIVSNPARNKSFVKWTPDPLPDMQSDGDLNVTLTRLVDDVSFNRGNDMPQKDPMSRAVLAAFHTEQKGVVVTNWQPVRITTSDASGNSIENNSWNNGRDDNGDATMTYQSGLWPGQTPWKLDVEMSRASGFNDDEVWTVQNVPVKPGSQQELWNYGGRNGGTTAAFAETTLNGIHLKLFHAIQFTDQNWGNGEKPGGFRVQADQALDGMQMTLVKATDEQRRDVPSWGENGWGGDSREIQLRNLRNAKFLNVTIALHKSRFVEFTVNPAKQ
jgi:hypothetical protein